MKLLQKRMKRIGTGIAALLQQLGAWWRQMFRPVSLSGLLISVGCQSLACGARRTSRTRALLGLTLAPFIDRS